MQFEGSYAGWGNLSVVFKTAENDCLKVYRRGVKEEIPRKEYDLLVNFNSRGMWVPKPKEITQVEFSSDTIDQITNEVLRKEFGKNGGSFTALRKSFVEGTQMGRHWLFSGSIWKKYVQVNEDLFSIGYTPYDFIPHNYIITPLGAVYLIDFDKVRKLSPHELPEERRAMRKVPLTRYGKVSFDIKRWLIEAINPSENL